MFQMKHYYTCLQNAGRHLNPEFVNQRVTGGTIKSITSDREEINPTTYNSSTEQIMRQSKNDNDLPSRYWQCSCNHYRLFNSEERAHSLPDPDRMVDIERNIIQQVTDIQIPAWFLVETK